MGDLVILQRWGKLGIRIKRGRVVRLLSVGGGGEGIEIKREGEVVELGLLEGGVGRQGLRKDCRQVLQVREIGGHRVREGIGERERGSERRGEVWRKIVRIRERVLERVVGGREGGGVCVAEKGVRVLRGRGRQCEGRGDVRGLPQGEGWRREDVVYGIHCEVLFSSPPVATHGGGGRATEHRKRKQRGRGRGRARGRARGGASESWGGRVRVCMRVAGACAGARGGSRRQRLARAKFGVRAFPKGSLRQVQTGRRGAALAARGAPPPWHVRRETSSVPDMLHCAVAHRTRPITDARAGRWNARAVPLCPPPHLLHPIALLCFRCKLHPASPIGYSVSINIIRGQASLHTSAPLPRAFVESVSTLQRAALSPNRNTQRLPLLAVSSFTSPFHLLYHLLYRFTTSTYKHYHRPLYCPSSVSDIVTWCRCVAYPALPTLSSVMCSITFSSNVCHCSTLPLCSCKSFICIPKRSAADRTRYSRPVHHDLKTSALASG